MPSAYMMPAPAPGTDVPLWKQQASTGINKYLYFGAGFIGLVIVGIILNSMGTITLPWQSSPEVRPTPPTISGSTDAARADNFTNTLLAPRMAALEDDVALANQTCAAGMTTACQENLIGIDNKISATLEMTNHIVVPFCIYPQYAALRADLTKLDAAEGAAYKGFRDNRAAEFQSGLSQFRAANSQVVADDAALVAATKACGIASGDRWIQA